ncbi:MULTISPECIES: tellurite resistance TerB family protein [unclassified Paracoccus (in: a-proteobacteria)]|uniref:tellurite resistance TerB family protein n=1 Tax=unclassified Paracoccus (in: a-proteobacteria) TaxID=2688777 RepID=UPI0021E18E0B|nr:MULTISPECIES: tellurite resistance TerB family protein [unclassified Paracoccus (in: a-proteobacteria)]UXU76051.1 tellurite resistance TerB family protein [Paracoccus sp. SMMA_5]UXU81962.1 tellurite resistance TerB family protein [Paracoccus sp. SMMA_5_TC]
MSLMKSLARVAAGVMLAKGIGTMMKNAQNRPHGSGQTAGRQGSGGLLDELLGNNTGQAGSRSAGSGGLGDLLGQVLGGRSPGAGSGSSYGGSHSPRQAGASGGLGGILDQLTRAGQGSSQAGSAGGLGSILGGAAAGSLGGILGDLLGGRGSAQAGGAQTGGLAQKGAQAQNDSSFGELLNEALATGNEPSTPPTAEQNAVAGLMLKAMIQAAKADGEIDEQEKARLMDQFGDLDEDERAFIREQMAAPVDVAGLVREVPQGLGPQVYLMSLMAIDFDNRKEAEYLHQLAEGLGLDRDTVNGIHQQVGVVNLYA